jgi:hypothetical protein
MFEPGLAVSLYGTCSLKLCSAEFVAELSLGILKKTNSC